jgi:hypothetical protein
VHHGLNGEVWNVVEVLGETMTPSDQAPIDVTAAPRAVLRESVRLLYRVLGEERLGTARGNAWAAVCDNRRHAEDRQEVDRLLADARTRAPATAPPPIPQDPRDHELWFMIGDILRP